MFYAQLPAAVQALEASLPPMAPNAITVLEKRYFTRDGVRIVNGKEEDILTEDAPGLFWRTALHLAQAERKYYSDDNALTEEAEEANLTQHIMLTALKFYNLMRGYRWLPNSPTLANAGTRTGQLSACFVLPIADAMSQLDLLAKGAIKYASGIYDTLKDAQLVFQTGGGCGYAFSRLRSKSRLVRKSQGKASGPVSFMNVYNEACEQIKQGGVRRGAQMGILRVDHPDIIEFILAKQDLSKLTNFNVSVAITQAYLDALEAGGDYELIDPEYGPTGQFLNALQVFKDIVARAWKTGEPGLFFVDRANNYNPVPKLGDYEATNPCWTGDTKVWTVNGHVSFAELAERGEDIQVLSQDDAGTFVVKMMRSPRLTRKSVEVVELHLDDGTVLKATPDHNVYLRDGRKVHVEDLQPGDSLASVYRYKANSKGYLRISNGVEGPLYHHVMVSAHAGRRPEYPTEHCHHINEDKSDNSPENLEIKPGSEHNSEHMLGEENPMSGIWDERNPLYLIPTDGENNGRYRHDISDTELQAMRASGKSFKKIAEEAGCSKYTVMKRLGWTRPEKETAVVNHKVLQVVRTGEVADVYNGTVDDTHRYFVVCGEHDAILSANCGEQPLIPYESCNLGSITLDTYVAEDAEQPGAAEFNYAAFDADVYDSIHAMDNVVDMNEYVPGVPQIKEITLKTRKLGLGEMGLARALFKLGLAYNTEEGRNFASYTYARLDVAAHEASVELAKTRGAYPYFQENWDESVKFHARKLMERVRKCEEMGFQDLAERYARVIIDIRQYGLRNSTLTTIAPTGTLSIVHDTSGGCEPVFALAFKRWQAGVTMYDVDKVFAAELRQRGFSAAEVQLVQEKVDAHGGSLVNFLAASDADKLPDTKLLLQRWEALDEMAKVYVTAGDTSPRDHVLMQAAHQHFCDSAISKTINMPAEATVEDVAVAYRMAIELGLKGITVYRDGCRDSQPLSTTATQAPSADKLVALDNTGSISVDIPAPPVESRPRPRLSQLFGFTDRRETGSGRLYTVVNYDDEGIREVVTTVGRSGGVLHSMTEAIGRLISLALKYRVPVKEIWGTLRGIRGGDPYGFGPNQTLSVADAIGRILQEAPARLQLPGQLAESAPAVAAVEAAVHAHEKSGLDNVQHFGASPECPECYTKLMFESGCKGGTCPNVSCGWSKC